MSIKARLIITISLVVALAFAAIGVVTVTVARERMIERVDDTLLAAPLRPPREFAEGDADGDGQGQGAFDGGRRETATLFVGAGGVVRMAIPSGFTGDPDPLPAVSVNDLRAHAGALYTTGAADGSDRSYRVLVHPLQGGFLVQAAPLDDVEATVDSLIAIVTITGLAVLALVMLAVWLSVQRGLRPIDAMIGTAGLIAEGDLSQRVEHDDAATEVGRLGHALNAMLGRIETSFSEKEASERRLRQFVADASHELRTPLTSIRGYAELFRSGAASDPATLERVMLRIESEGERMSTLVEDLLLLARLDQGRPLEQAPVDLVALVDDAVQDARLLAPDRTITFDHPLEATVTGDADRLRQVVGNLLTNARVHTTPGTPVRVSLSATLKEVVLTVADDGPGIPPESAARIFDRFYRVDTSRTRADTNGGTGLGLAIVASIVAAHGGQVTVETEVGRGTAFTVTLVRLPGYELVFDPVGT